MFTGRISAAVVVVIALFGATACAPSGTDPTPPTVETPSDAQGEQPPAASPVESAEPAPPSGTLDALQAVDAAVQAAGGVVVELGRDREAGRDVWEVGVLRDDGTGAELYLDTETGEVVRERALELDSAQRVAPAATASDAITIALSAVPGSIVELDLDTEGSRIVWEVQIDADEGGRYELYIDAATGDIVKQERAD